MALTNNHCHVELMDMPSKPIKPRSDFETPNTQNAFLYLSFYFCSKCKAKRVSIFGYKVQHIIVEKQGHCRHFNACLCLYPHPRNRATRQDSRLKTSDFFFFAEFKTSDFSSQCKRKIILQNYILHPMNLVNVKKSF